MNRITLALYDYFRKHPYLSWMLGVALTIAFVLSILTLHYSEDISDFLPLDEENQTALSVYQDISGANKIYAIISTKDTVDVSPQELVDGVESFVSNVESTDSLHYVNDIMKEVDMERMLGLADVVYENIPYFLTDADYARMDSLLSQPEYIDKQLGEDKQMLLFPSSNLLTVNHATH
jgi:predicted outer membrane lipoprotein